ncbi:MAG: pantoate--beta-alanine ligase [Longimicrobiales bacterium]|nr:pantoate--beta-alanine ligase [Longimicrobiales bacterium]
MIVARNRVELREGLDALETEDGLETKRPSEAGDAIEVGEGIGSEGVRGSRGGSPRMSVARPRAFVPTMGALHAGHLALVKRARGWADAQRASRGRPGVVVLSIFVNPTQFGPDEDFGAYPRPLETDLEKAREHGVDLVFAPESEAVVYPEGEPRITVDPGSMADRLCGAYRPGHFRGVLTVVAKLFGLVGPDRAVFGRKDFQQAVLIQRMVQDLELGVEIDVAPLIREEDGLALSSRNAYLSSEERASALGLFAGLSAARERFQRGEREASELKEAVRSEAARHPLLDLEYVEVVDRRDLEPVDRAEAGSVVAVAGFCGETRLIDNVVLGE